ncbi:nitroreductase family protein [Bifidobacterium scaligerum]|uniref:Nitroreductase n=1 Tax=Bifidobacterium scaligerum TaxID=2052656 RepID=A0A2M9HQX9_9BIFI|nr:nitroreductase family protein [Bifidobacterium scaligerum]PJM79214.1 nitroreductase [Bifidobacterium scaligerum]
MAEHTQLIDAINIRTAVRAYDNEPIDDDTARQLEMTLQPLNLIADLNIQLVRDQPKVFAEANASGHLTNAANYLAIVGPKNDDEAKERAGFYAERAVLAATLRGLGTLWVAGSWDRAEAARHCRVTGAQELYLGVVIGHPENHLEYQAKSYEELVEAQRTHRSTKTFEQFTAGMQQDERDAAPAWFKSGVEAAMKAPSAMNRQPVLFTYNAADDTAAAHIDPAAGDEHWALNDLGIAKLHFQIGAGQGQWAWGDGGLFIHK